VADSVEIVVDGVAIRVAPDVSLAAAALQFSLRDPRIHSTIVGVSKPERIAQTLELAAQPIPDEIWPKLDAVGYTMDDPEATRWRD
jgi:D-threo-aldose 1-dehydrogenase